MGGISRIRRPPKKDPIRPGLDRIGGIAKGAGSLRHSLWNERTYFFFEDFFADFFAAFFFAGIEITSSWPLFA